MGHFEDTFRLQVKEVKQSCQAPPRWDSILAPGTSQGGVGPDTETVHKSASQCGQGIRVVQQFCPSSKS